jgi:hypothetical protein
MYRAVIAATLAGLTLSGCASSPVSAPTDFAWSYADNPGEGAKLAYGRPQSDEVLLMMTCAPGAQVILSAAAMGGSRVMLASGNQKTSLDGVVTEGFDGQGFVEAETSSRGPAMRGFRRSGDLTLTSGARSFELAAKDSERPAVRRFFDACEMT